MSDEAQSRFYMPGATTIGLVYSEGVILASEKRVTYGSMIMSQGSGSPSKTVLIRLKETNDG